ncbi:MAG: YggS family pyridoxal phosphate-dependent enzyme [Elusimicrobiota bacterium]
MTRGQIRENVREVLSELPEGIRLVAACKTRTAEEIQQAVEAGITIIGENHIQEAERSFHNIEGDIKWHFIGHLQKNKVKKAVKIFDMIESLDSPELARIIDKECRKIDKIMECLVEVNSGREDNKYGFMPEDVEGFILEAKDLLNIRISGLMTMGPFMGTPEEFRPYFSLTRKLFEDIKEKKIPSCEMKYLSMGMSASYKTAIEEGANMVRIGTRLFGFRDYSC